jgi:perosamine synthetase
MNKLALSGGERTIKAPFSRYNPIGKEELAAAHDVISSGVLSKFIGGWEPDFYGGPKVQAFERACETVFQVKHAVTVNSWTSGLIAAVGAAGVSPGDEVIVTPWTMSASATAILAWNAIPVFADIERETFNIDPASIEKNISPLTKAIMVVDIFGHSADLDPIMQIAERHNLIVITDSAQSPFALYKGRFAGTVSHIGGYSLNYHKHIHTGEGGICVTNNPRFAERLQLIRNHAEAVVGDKGVEDISNMIGFNFRLGEIEAAIGIEQLRKLPKLAAKRTAAAERLSRGLEKLPGLKLPVVKPGCTHVHYVYPLLLNEKITGIARARIVEALSAEGVPGLMNGYANLHLLPMYQRRIAYGTNGFPWTPENYKGSVSYKKGICPVAESLHDREFMGIEFCLHDYTDDQIDLVIQAFQKVWQHLDQLG